METSQKKQAIGNFIMSVNALMRKPHGKKKVLKIVGKRIYFIGNDRHSDFFKLKEIEKLTIDELNSFSQNMNNAIHIVSSSSL